MENLLYLDVPILKHITVHSMNTVKILLELEYLDCSVRETMRNNVDPDQMALRKAP